MYVLRPDYWTKLLSCFPFQFLLYILYFLLHSLPFLSVSSFISATILESPLISLKKSLSFTKWYQSLHSLAGWELHSTMVSVRDLEDALRTVEEQMTDSMNSLREEMRKGQETAKGKIYSWECWEHKNKFGCSPKGNATMGGQHG